MDAQLFLAEFGHIANAPGGIERLRELIYQFAVTGRLVPQQAEEGSAEPVLENVARIRRRLIAEKRWKRAPRLESAPLMPPAIELPPSWRWSRLLDLGEINPRNLASDDAQATFVPMAAVSEKHGQAVGGEDAAWADISKGYTHFANGDVLLAKITPCFENGKAAVVSGLKHGIGSGSTEFHVFRPMCEDVNAAYVYLFLRSPLFRATGQTSMTGTAGQKRLPTDYFALCAMPLPPKAEQTRVVAQVDELMALCDKLEEQQKTRRKLQNALRLAALQAVAHAQSPHELQASWARLEANFSHIFSVPEDVKDLRSLCVELAIRGELLTSETGGDGRETDQLIRQLQLRKKGKRTAKAIEPAEQFSLPVGWRWVLFDDLVDGSDSGWSPKCDAEARRPGEWGVLKVSAVTWGEFRAGENKRLPLSLEPRIECQVMPGDFLLSRANTAELVARSVIAPSEVEDKLLMSDKIVRLNFLDSDLKPWANLVNNSQYARDYYRSRATGTSDSMRNISRQVIHELPIPLPPKLIQRTVLERLGKLTARCNRLEQLLAETGRQAKLLATIAIAQITGIAIEQEGDGPLKVPQTELISSLRLGQAPSVKEQAPLASLLARHNGELSARDLWQRFGGEIDTFYAQLKTEVAHGWIQEPAVAEVHEKTSEAV